MPERFLTLEQARTIMKLWREKTVALYGNDLDLVGDGLIEALDELIVLPGTPSYCEGCLEWRLSYSAYPPAFPRAGAKLFTTKCRHDDFDGEHCPEGRYDAS